MEPSQAPTADVSVCIPAYGPSPHLAAVVEALQAQTAPPREIIVAHSGDGDPSGWLTGSGTCAPSSRTGDGEVGGVPVTVIHSPRRWCAGEARNQAAATARGAWLAFIDADVRPARDWLEQLLAARALYGDRAIIGGSIGYAEPGGYWGLSLWAAEFSSHHPYVPSATRHAIGSFTTLVQRRLFDEVGGYPVGYFPAEDVAFAQRIRAAGGEAVYHQGPYVAHYNVAGLGHFLRHTAELARSSARVRRELSLPGSAATAFPPLAFGAAATRLALIYGRVLRHGQGQRLTFLGLLPGVAAHLAVWSSVFFSESVRATLHGGGAP